MLQGEYRHTMDAKGRFFFPAPMKEDISERPTVCRGIGSYLWVFSEKDWKTFTDKIGALPYTDSVKMRHFFIAKSQEAQIDAQGRVVIPQYMREYAGLIKNIVIVGSLDRVEIWDEAKWNNETEGIEVPTIMDIMERYSF